MNGLRLPIRVKPGSSRIKVGGSWGDDPARLVVAVQAQAVDGKANVATVAALGKALGVPKRDVEVVSGLTNRSKMVAITDPPDGLAALIKELMRQ